MLSCVRGICLVSVLSSLAVTFLLSISFALFLKRRYVCVCVHTYMYTENCKHDKHEECHYHFSETQLIREWELLYYIIYVCVKSIMSQKSDDDAHHVSCLQFSLFSLGLLHFLLLRDTFRLFSKWFFSTVNYSLFQMHLLGLQVLHHKSLSNIVKRLFLVIYFILCMKCSNSLSPVMLITLVERKDEM